MCLSLTIVRKRAVRIARLYFALRSMYESASVGARVRNPVPKRNRGEAYRAFFERVRTALAPGEVALYSCADAYRAAFCTEHEWLACGVIAVLRGGIYVLGTGDVATSVASMRVNFAKGDDGATRSCCSCTSARCELTCSVCWTGVCKRCFVDAHIHAPDPGVWRCPGCRGEASISDAASSIQHATRATRMGPFATIRAAMNGLGLKKARVCIEAIDTRVARHAPRSRDRHAIQNPPPIVLRRYYVNVHLVARETGGSCGVRFYSSQRVVFETRSTSDRVVSAILHCKDTLFTMGRVVQGPCPYRMGTSMGTSTGTSTGDRRIRATARSDEWCATNVREGLRSDITARSPDSLSLVGRAYVVGDRGFVDELVGMFGAVSMMVRSWSSVVAL